MRGPVFVDQRLWRRRVEQIGVVVLGQLLALVAQGAHERVVEGDQPAAHVEYSETEATTMTDVGPSSASVVDSFGFLIHFAYDSAEILPESRPYIDSVGAMLRLPEAQGRKLKIVGHTDARGSEQYNQALSERRAAAVRSYLKAEFGVAADQLEIMSEGETAPVAGSDPNAAENRRVEFHAG